MRYTTKQTKNTLKGYVIIDTITNTEIASGTLEFVTATSDNLNDKYNKKIEDDRIEAEKKDLVRIKYIQELENSRLAKEQYVNDQVTKELNRLALDSKSKNIDELRLLLTNHFMKLLSKNTQYKGVSLANQYRTPRQAHCWYCKVSLDNSIDYECNNCGWILCECGACGCGR